MEPKQQPPYPLRISVELRERLEAEAARAKRSLNAEIADRLEQSFRPSSITDAALASSLANAEVELATQTLEVRSFIFLHAQTAASLLQLFEADEKLARKALGTKEEFASAYQIAAEAIDTAQAADEEVDLDKLVAAAELADRRARAARKALSQVAQETIVPTVRRRAVLNDSPNNHPPAAKSRRTKSVD